MQIHSAMPAKILICLVGRRRGDTLVAAAKAAGARGATVAPGKYSGDNRLLHALSLDDVRQDVVYIVMGEEADRVTAAVKAVGVAAPLKMGGLAMFMEATTLYTRFDSPSNRQNPASAPAERSTRMESGYKLINVIVNSGYANDVMEAARKAGARGGSILTARGTGTEEDVKFFGITLVPEKEMLLIVTESDKVAPIVAAIGQVPTLAEPGGGIVFSMNVEEFIVLGK